MFTSQNAKADSRTLYAILLSVAVVISGVTVYSLIWPFNSLIVDISMVCLCGVGVGTAISYAAILFKESKAHHMSDL